MAQIQPGQVAQGGWLLEHHEADCHGCLRGMAVSLSGYSSTREARAVLPRVSVYIQVGNSTRHERKALAPCPNPGC